jgi:acyl-coenzyme A synthetase/AMP-(fatty) acid ligase
MAMTKLFWEGRVAHRMGDLGRFDDEGRLWFGGRRSHRVRSAHGDVPTVPVESLVDQHPAVARSALVGVGQPGEQRLVVCVELEPGYNDDVLDEILSFIDDHAEAAVVGAERVERLLSHKGFPTDVRHNSKIDRPALALWAQKRVE